MFAASTGFGTEPWWTDGTAAGTTLVARQAGLHGSANVAIWDLTGPPDADPLAHGDEEPVEGDWTATSITIQVDE